jgi:zinc-binding alcohol dehydrogenase/oxidoreductase
VELPYFGMFPNCKQIIVKMKAAVLNALHTPLEVTDVPEPFADSGHLVVDVQYAALNHRDLWIQKGQYARITLPLIPGSDASGMVENRPVLINPSIHWGEDQRFQGRDYRILGLPDAGTLAEKVVVPADKVYPVPAHLTMPEAAVLPLGGLTAYRALVVKCRPEAGERVFISGVGGGVATLAFQMALAMGCQVYVSSGSEWKRKKALEMGASGAFDYRDPEMIKKIQEQTDGFDIIIDSAAGSAFTPLLKVCRPGARICFYGGTLGNITDLNPQIIFWKQLTIMGSTMGSDQDFSQMLSFVTRHKIQPVVDSVFPLDRINDAFAYMQEGQQFGKIAIKVVA